MSPRRTSRRRASRLSASAQKKHTLGLIIIGLLVIIFSGGGFAYFWLTGHRVALDESFCPTDQPPSLVVAVLLDLSDPINPVQRADVLNRLLDLRDEIPRYGSIEIYAAGSTTEGLRTPLFKACNPGRPDEINQWAEPLQKARNRWQNEFETPLRTTLEQSLLSQPANESPILESIQSVSISAYSGNRLTGAPKRLVIVSDMLQNTKNLSHYRERPDFARFRQSSSYVHTRAILEGVEIEILYLRRRDASHIQDRHHIEFWQQYFADQGGTIVHVVSVEG